MENQVVTPQAVAHVVGAGGFWSRAMIADGLGRSKSTWVIANIEMAVAAGLIEKYPGTVGPRPGWVYSVPGLQKMLSGFDSGEVA